MVSEDEVEKYFFYILGRRPESEAVIDAHRQFNNVEELRVALLRSQEVGKAIQAVNFEKSKWVLTDVFNGKRKMWVDLSDQAVSYGCLLDNYEPIEAEIIRKFVKPGNQVCDIGANIGWHTLNLADSVGKIGHVFAFEPREPTFSYLKKNVIENNLQDQVSLFNVGVWNVRDNAHLTWAESTPNPGGSHIYTGHDSGIMQKIELFPLDMLVNIKIDFIKIDIEGAEYKALSGSKCLINHRPIVMSEIYDLQLRNISNVDADMYIRMFLELNYQCLSLNTDQLYKNITSSQQLSQDINSVLFLPEVS